MLWVFAGVAVVLVVLIALVAVGREAFTLGAQPRQALFDLDEAVDYVADHLPPHVTARLSYDDVRRLLTWHIEYLREKGVPGTRDAAITTNGSDSVVIDEDEPTAYLLLRAERSAVDADADDVVAVLEAEAAYFDAIGAIGPEADETHS
ncbi:MAG: hypothetical protein ACRD29_03775 [Acidimicrobiales bacterium]